MNIEKLLKVGHRLGSVAKNNFTTKANIDRLIDYIEANDTMDEVLKLCLLHCDGMEECQELTDVAQSDKQGERLKALQYVFLGYTEGLSSSVEGDRQ